MPPRVVSRVHAQPAPAPVPLGLPVETPARQYLWRGASGRDYLHSVYGLIECPPLPKATYILVRRGTNGEVTVLHISLGRHEAATLNLAKVRQRGAQLGANEVHVYFAARSDEARTLVVCDLRAGQFGALSSEPKHATTV
jgi:hypothetical protein